MAEKRMFSKSIVLSDAFLDMPATSRCLYFTLSMLADDDGFVNSPKAIMRQSGATEDDLKILIAKKFVLPFESGVIVIKHWRINNYLRCDRYRETKYLEEKQQIEIEKNGAYTLKSSPSILTNVEIKPEKTSEKKKVPLLEREPVNDIERVEKIYLENYRQLFNSGIVKNEKPIVNWTASRKLTKDWLQKYGLEIIEEAVKKSIDNKFVVSRGYVLTTILSAGVLAQLINSTDGRIDNDSIKKMEVDF